MYGQMSLECPDKNPPEKEKEKKKERDLDLDKEKEENSKNRISSTDLQTIIDKWNSLGVKKIKFIKNNTDMYKMLNARIKEYGIDTFLQTMEKIRYSTFLKNSKDTYWFNFDWFISPNNFIKVLEGNYDDKENKGGFNNEPRSNTSKNNEPSKGESKEDEHDAEYWKEQNRILDEMLDSYLQM